MRVSTVTCRLLAVCLALGAAPVLAENVDVELEVGYQWLDVSGNEDVYRSQVDDDDGFVLRGLTVSSLRRPGEEGAYDRLRIDAAGYDGSPDGSFRLQLSRDRLYDLQVNQRSHRYFNALPTFANPLEASVGQHTLDRSSDAFDLELELFPGRKLTPILGFRSSQYDGPGTTTRHIGEDDFLLRQDIDQEEQELSLGLAFDLGPTFRGTVMQGWRNRDDDEVLSLGEAGGGNGSGTVLGRSVTLDDYQRSSETEVDGTVTTVYLTGRAGDRVRLAGSYVRSDFDSDVLSTEDLNGSLVSFELSRFFEGLEERVQGASESDAWRGEARLDADLTDRVSVAARYGGSSVSIDGTSLITTFFLDPATFGGASQDDIERLLDTRNAYDRDEDQIEVVVNARDLGPFRAWAGYLNIAQDVTVSEDAAEIVLPDGQGGAFERDIDRYTLGVELDLDEVSVSLERVSEDADNAVVRTDFLDRDRWRARVAYTPADWVRLRGTWEDIEADNDTVGIDYSGEVEHVGVGLDITPIPELTVDFTWDRYQSDSSVTIRRPETFTLTPSLYSEDGDLAEGGVAWRRDRFNLEARYSQFDNEGSLAVRLERAYLYFGCDVSGPYGFAVELEDWSYEESGFSLADYDATRYGVFLRYRRR